MTDETEDFDHEGTDSPVCPHCGHEISDGAEAHDGNESTRIECDECGEEFDSFAEVSVTYSTFKIDPEAEARRLARQEEDRQRFLQERAAARAACQKFTPGMRIRVKDSAEARHLRGREGVVENRELPRNASCVRVTLSGSTRADNIDPVDLEEVH